MYGDMNLLNTGASYPFRSPGRGHAGRAGAGRRHVRHQSFGHSFPFSPYAGDFPGTDQIYTSTTQTAGGDGYSTYGGRLPGPQVLTLDYSSLVPVGQTVQTLTLGIAADDFQFPMFGQPFVAAVNGTTEQTLTNSLNGINETGPLVQYLTIGIDPSRLLASNVLTLSINENGDGSDGWAVDFLTIGVTTVPVPEPSSLGLIALAGGGWLVTRRRRTALTAINSGSRRPA